MKRLIHRQRIPYGGEYVLNDAAAGMVGRGPWFDRVVDSVKSWRKANGYPIGLSIEDEIEQCVCAKYPDECKETDPQTLPKPRRLRYGEILVGTQVMLRFVASGMKVVEPAEAERRAAICATCKYNAAVAMPCGGPCGTLKRIIETAIGHRKTQQHDQLRSCQLCGCFLSVAVWVPLQVQVPPLTDGQKAQFEQVSNCWKKASLL